MIQHLGTFPASSVNVGLAAAPAGLAVEVARLQEAIVKLTLAGATQIQLAGILATNPPDPAKYGLAAQVALNPASLVMNFDPSKLGLIVAPSVLPAMTVELGAAEAQLAVLSPLVGGLRTGLDTPGIAGWTYSGRAAGFGAKLASGTQSGFGGVPPNQPVSAVIVATNNFASWQSFSEGIDTGGSANTNLGTSTKQERLAFHGVRGAGSWSVGLDRVLKPLDITLSTLEGTRNRITSTLQILSGVVIPDVEPAISAALGGLSIDGWVTERLPDMLEAMLGVNVNYDAQIDGVAVKIDNVLELINDIEVSLSGGGLTMWSYSGPAGALGADFAPEIAGGLPGTTGGPNGSTYGIVLASASPQAWDAFGSIFKTS
jgi:hypothetical protein